MSEWIKCEERMPESNGRYLIVLPTGLITASQYYCHHGKLFFGNTSATHWQPLPSAPKE